MATNHLRKYGESAWPYLASIFPDALIPFDLWVWNTDRHDGNLIAVESYGGETERIYGIDHGHAFGGQGRPGTRWDESPWSLNHAEILPVQLPEVARTRMVAGMTDKTSTITVCNAIASLPDVVVQYVVCRAASFTGEASDLDMGATVARALIARRTKVGDWIEAN